MQEAREVQGRGLILFSSKSVLARKARAAIAQPMRYRDAVITIQRSAMFAKCTQAGQYNTQMKGLLPLYLIHAYINTQAYQARS